MWLRYDYQRIVVLQRQLHPVDLCGIGTYQGSEKDIGHGVRELAARNKLANRLGEKQVERRERPTNGGIANGKVAGVFTHKTKTTIRRKLDNQIDQSVLRQTARQRACKKPQLQVKQKKNDGE